MDCGPLKREDDAGAAAWWGSSTGAERIMCPSWRTGAEGCEELEGLCCLQSLCTGATGANGLDGLCGDCAQPIALELKAADAKGACFPLSQALWRSAGFTYMGIHMLKKCC